MGIMLFEITFNINRKLNNPIMIAGLPGMGLTGKQALDYLIKVFNAKKISTIHTPYLGSPAVSVHNGIVEDIPEEIYTFFLASTDDMDIILFTSQSQPATPEWQHIVAERAVSAIKKYGVSTVYTLAATPIPYFKDEADVYGVATSPDLVEMLRLNGVKPLSGEGAISGINGLLLGYAKKYGMEGICLLGETYLVSGMDKIAPLAVLKALTKILRLDIDLSELEEEARRFREQMALTARYLTRRGEEEEGRERPRYIY
jgi:uncharacterized protein (TIGR00162 family)